MLKSFLANKIVNPFKKFPYFGRQRFWALYWAYRLTGWHIRHKEWDWILEYLPKFHNRHQYVQLLDVGCSRNLFCYEIKHRGYHLSGIDVEVPDFKYPGIFRIADITDKSFDKKYDFITCISVLEHIGREGRGSFQEQEVAVINMCESLKPGGRLLLTIPTREFAQGHIWHGFASSEIWDMLPKGFQVHECIERAGQYCFCIGRKA